MRNDRDRLMTRGLLLMVLGLACWAIANWLMTWPAPWARKTTAEGVWTSAVAPHP